MSKLTTLFKYLDAFDYGGNEPCTAVWLETRYFNECSKKQKDFRYKTAEVCDAMADCAECVYGSSNSVRVIRRIIDGIADVNPSDPF